MSLPRYPEYRESGIEWASQFPAHWLLASLKWLCKRYSGGTPDKDNEEYWEAGTIPWLNSGAVNDGHIYEPSAYITQAALDSSSAKWIPAGALVMALAGQGKTKGMVAQLMFQSTCNQSMAAIVPSHQINGRFLYWWLVSNYQNIRNMAGGDLRDGLNLELLGSIPCPVPLLEEQTAIANFLDCESEKIDTLIAEQDKLIAMLAEKRQAAISHAVTRGLNADAPMRDSGVASIGEIPSHWICMPLKTLFRQQKRRGFPDKDVLSVYRDFGVILKNSRTDNFNKTPEDLTSYQLVNPRDLVVNKMKAWQGSLGISTHAGITSPDYMVFVPIHSEVSTFLHFLLRSWPIVSYFRGISNGIRLAQWRLEPDEFLNMNIFVPPVSEQQEIVEFCEGETRRLDLLLADTERAMFLLEERRAALVSAAVTGQIDVRRASHAPRLVTAEPALEAR